MCGCQIDKALYRSIINMLCVKGAVILALVVLLLKEKLPQAFMQIGWKDDDFRNLKPNPIKRYDFSKVSLILCMAPSQVALF